MTRNQRIIAAVIGAVFVALLGAAALSTPDASGTIARGVSVDGIAVGGMAPQAATNALNAHEDALAALPVVVRADGNEFVASPEQLGFSFDIESAVSAAGAIGRDSGVLGRAFRWLKSFASDTDLDLVASLDPSAVSATLDEWDIELAGRADSNATINVENGTLVATYETPSPALVRAGLSERLLEVVLNSDRPAISVDTALANRGVPDAEVDRALENARALLAGPITLTNTEPPSTLALSVADLTGALRSVVDNTTMSITLDVATLEPKFEALRSDFASTFKNAELIIDDDDSVSILPGETGLRVDSAGIVAAALAASKTGSRTGTLPVTADAAPDVTVADLEALRIEHLVSSFTTYHDCCQNRVVNIQLMADTVNGTIVMPGDTFSINDLVGRRTEEKGYLPAGTIVDGEIVDTIGGGVSQFATTTYNAVFWGGYTDVTHRPHSIYFSRYPEGIEATLDFPNIDLAFRNDTDGAVYIKTEHTTTSITVKLFASNGGRTVEGDQRDGSTNLAVTSDGDTAVAYQVTGSVSGRFNFTSPDTIYEADTEIEPGTSNTKQSGRDGWSVTITRTITYPDTTQDTQEWVARYRSRPLILEVHPCEIPDGESGFTGEPCPTTTTTTTTSTSLPDDSSTTTSSSATTTP